MSANLLSSLRGLFFAVASAAILSATTNTATAERSVTLGWEPSPDSGVTGYYVYTLEENAASPSRIDAGANSSAVVNGLKEGLRYTFAVTAYDAYRAESLPSAEVTFVVPVPMTMSQPTSSSDPRRIQFPVAPGRWYEVQASTDLQNWTTVWQTGVANSYSTIEYQDPQSRNHNSRFYRLQVH